MAHALSTDNGSSSKFDRIVADLHETGFSICDGFVSPLQVSNMALEAKKQYKKGAFRHARVGRGASMQLRPEIRNDRVLWLDSEKPGAALLPYFLDLETLRKEINRNLYMGLFEFEGHFALYPPGASYDIHFDRFIGTMERVVTCILYLNDNWQPDEGGALKVYEGTEPSNLPLPMEVIPQGGRLVTFISELFPHEVLPARRDRLSLTGWFRIRS
ncbi:SM-20-related protein [Mariprofundus ferrinatatus]|uniref:SM-20-related protein n=1 Tax=Mariprofundus ferrinatatus TaxID=1921087 RepID=A0A2K8L8P0_9PROT|nr:2OG-Fe(II) oxygenase [Mariprofundus ferrinatatus]ATX81304.1 SM-20-related protein [Mariprofundus ferrinatatus]